MTEKCVGGSRVLILTECDRWRGTVQYELCPPGYPERHVCAFMCVLRKKRKEGGNPFSTKAELLQGVVEWTWWVR